MQGCRKNIPAIFGGNTGLVTPPIRIGDSTLRRGASGTVFWRFRGVRGRIWIQERHWDPPTLLAYGPCPQEPFSPSPPLDRPLSGWFFKNSLRTCFLKYSGTLSASSVPKQVGSMLKGERQLKTSFHYCNELGACHSQPLYAMLGDSERMEMLMGSALSKRIERGRGALSVFYRQPQARVS